MDDREFYQKQAITLKRIVPQDFAGLAFPQELLQKDSSGDYVLRSDKFRGSTLCGEKVCDAEKVVVIRHQRIKRLNRLLKGHYLQQPYNFALTVRDILQHERFKSIHTAFSRLSDIHLLLQGMRDILSQDSDSFEQQQKGFDMLLQAYNRLFAIKEERVKNHKAALLAEKHLYLDFTPEIRGQNDLDDISAERYELFLLNMLIGYYPAFIRNYKLCNINLAKDDFISGGQLQILVHTGKPARKHLTLSRGHFALFDCLIKYRQHQKAKNLFRSLPEKS